MRRINTTFIALASALLLCSCSSSKLSEDFSKFSKITESSEKIPDFKYESWKLENGLKVFFTEDKELPLFSASIFMRGGSFWEVTDQTGLYSALGSNMRSGGAGKYSPIELDAEVDKYAASLSSSFGQEFGSISVSGLSTDKEALFGLFKDVLLNPKFDDRRLQIWKGQSLEAIKRRVDDPNTIASMSTRTLLLGNSSYGRFSTSKDIKAINRNKLIALHQKAIIPNGAILAISGDMSKEDAYNLSQNYFSSWPKAQSAISEPPPYPAQKNTGIYFIEKDLKQATVIAAHLGPDRHTPDIYKIEVFNQYFGSGGFGSALMKRVRTELGLAYGVYGAILPGYPKGRALIHLQTKPETVGLALQESLATLNKIRTQEISYEEMLEAKNALSNTFVFNFTSASQVLGRKVEYALTGFPENYEDNYLESIRSITSEDIKNLAQKAWNFEDLIIMVVGPKPALTSLEQAISKLPEPLSKNKIISGKFDENPFFTIKNNSDTKF
jgi:zinc protease